MKFGGINDPCPRNEACYDGLLCNGTDVSKDNPGTCQDLSERVGIFAI